MDMNSITPSTRTQEKYKKLYNQVENLYRNDFYSISRACNQLRISATQYYRICKSLGKSSAASQQHVAPSVLHDKAQSYYSTPELPTCTSNWIEYCEIKKP